MKSILRYWKVLLALVLIAVAAFLYYGKYENEKADYETQIQFLQQTERVLFNSIEKNKRYEDIQDELEAAIMELDASRLDLYQHFPVEIREEDQIMYVLYLETLFGTEIHFAFNQAKVLTGLYQGSTLQGLVLQVNYETTYEGFKEMINYLATDDRIVSVYDATISYDAHNDVATGVVDLVMYLISDGDGSREYANPDVAIPELGKDNLFN